VVRRQVRATLLVREDLQIVSEPHSFHIIVEKIWDVR